MKLGAVSEMQRVNGVGGSCATESYHSDLADVYKRLLYVSLPYLPTRSSANVVYRDAMGSEETAGSVFLRYAPSWLMSIISFGLWVSPIKNKMMVMVDEALASAQKASATLIKVRKAALEIGEDATDVDLLRLICEYYELVVAYYILMDVCEVEANADSEAKRRLTDHELVAQIITL